MSNPQLFLRRPTMDDLPELVIPKGFTLHTHQEGREAQWEDLVEAAFGTRYSFEKFILNGGGYKPEYVFYVAKDGKDIATATAVEKDIFPGEGWFRMVGTHPDARGLGAGRMVLIAALHSLAERGYKSTVVSTDDHRLPSISLYLSLGFEPLMTHESHPARWETVLKAVNERKKK